MTRSPPPDSEADIPGGLQAALAASGVVGGWVHDIWADRLVVSAPVARALGWSPEEGARGVPLASLLSRTHEEDRARVDNALHAAIARGGAFALSFRTRAPRRLDLRGRIEPDAAGRPVRARGIVLEPAEDRVVGVRDQHAVNRMAEHAIALRGLADDLARPGLSRLLDRLMVEIGHELARHLRDAQDGRRH
ncbi:PAS domain-containing protein [Methylobacterium sp. M6A4_1b]